MKIGELKNTLDRIKKLPIQNAKIISIGLNSVLVKCDNDKNGSYILVVNN